MDHDKPTKILVDMIMSARREPGGGGSALQVPQAARRRVETQPASRPRFSRPGRSSRERGRAAYPFRPVRAARSGLIVHILALSAFRYGFRQSDFLSDQTAATILAMATIRSRAVSI